LTQSPAVSVFRIPKPFLIKFITASRCLTKARIGGDRSGIRAGRAY
jgi:hypothetical protein